MLIVILFIIGIAMYIMNPTKYSRLETKIGPIDTIAGPDTFRDIKWIVEPGTYNIPVVTDLPNGSYIVHVGQHWFKCYNPIPKRWRKDVIGPWVDNMITVDADSMYVFVSGNSTILVR